MQLARRSRHTSQRLRRPGWMTFCRGSPPRFHAAAAPSRTAPTARPLISRPAPSMRPPAPSAPHASAPRGPPAQTSSQAAAPPSTRWRALPGSGNITHLYLVNFHRNPPDIRKPLYNVKCSGTVAHLKLLKSWKVRYKAANQTCG